MKHISIYTTPVCVYCKKVKDLFQKNGIQYEEYNVIKDMKRREEMINKTGQMGVPVIEIDGQFVVGFDERKLKELLSIGR